MIFLVADLHPPTVLTDSPSYIPSGSTLVGDINLFLNKESEAPSDAYTKVAEINVMIAEPSGRRRGLGQEACKMMMQFGHEKYGIQVYIAKISKHNEASIRMFKDKLGYRMVRREIISFYSSERLIYLKSNIIGMR